MAVTLSELTIKNVNLTEAVASVVTNGKCVIHITAVSPKTLEIWVEFDGEGLRNKSYSMESQPEGNTGICMTDKDEYYFISSGGAALRLYKERIRIVYVSGDDASIICEGKEIGKSDDGAVYMYHKIADKEHFYGLGEDNDGYLGSLDRRGHTRDMITGQKINIGRVTADIPVTFYMSTGNGAPYGIFTDNSYPMYYDMGK